MGTSLPASPDKQPNCGAVAPVPPMPSPHSGFTLHVSPCHCHHGCCLQLVAQLHGPRWGTASTGLLLPERFWVMPGQNPLAPGKLHGTTAVSVDGSGERLARGQEVPMRPIGQGAWLRVS